MLLRQWLVASAILVGVLAGTGMYTVDYAEGLSYLSNDPQACANCHIMEDYLGSWQHSSHHAVAVCNDCHTPHDPLRKYLTKADNGWHHSVSFTFHQYPDNLQIREVNRRKLLENCVACHGELVEPINEIRGPADSAQAHGPHGEKAGELGAHTPGIDCLHCHSAVGHGPRK